MNIRINIYGKTLLALLLLCIGYGMQAQEKDNHSSAYKFTASVYPYLTKYAPHRMHYYRIYTYVDKNIRINKYVGDQNTLYTYILAGENKEHQIVVSGSSIFTGTEEYYPDRDNIPYILKPARKTKQIAGQEVKKYKLEMFGEKSIIWLSNLECIPPMDVPYSSALHRLIMAQQFHKNKGTVCMQILSINTQYVISPELLKACTEHTVNDTDIEAVFKE